MEKVFYFFNTVTFKQSLIHPIGKANIPFLARSYSKRSFAQQGEDLVLDRIFSRILKHDLSKPLIYCDVGANHPINNSVTYLMYNRNSQGICFDPSHTSKQLFKYHRNRDIFVCKAVGADDNIYVDFYIPDNAYDLSETSTKYPHRKNTYLKVKKHQINLNYELKRNNFYKIDFLNIDVEGAEYEILKTFDFNYFSPKVICVEIHADDIIEALETNVAKHIMKQGYRLIASTVISFFFVSTQELKKN